MLRRFSAGMVQVFIALLLAQGALASEHPRLLLNTEDVARIRAALASSPTFAASVRATRTRVDRHFSAVPDVPVPADAGGGYTHETHKKNGIAIHDAGVLFQFTGESVYAKHAAQLLLAYAAMYPSLGEHPKKKEQTPGRLFWQSLNESVWLVYAVQGYDAIHETLTPMERQQIEQGLLRPMADFLSSGSPETFNKIHNHGTWAVAAVGMTGFVLGDADYVEQALYGLARDGKAGFLLQLDDLFSPDGYYSEGPYYQRYALMPFVLFARSIYENRPQLKIFDYRGGILKKAIYTCIDLSYAGLFFPLNDAIKDKGLDTVELRYGVAVAYAITGDATLLDIATRQKSIVLTADGFAVAQAFDAGKAKPYAFKTTYFRDGAAGENGALVVLRSGAQPGHQAVVFKATAQGMGHGHFDKLNWLYYDNGQEIISDYGAARFLNIEQKYGGHYLPENKTWAKQSVAHNTLVVDERSHFDGKLSAGARHAPDKLFFKRDDQLQIASARMRGAYDGVEFQRTLALLSNLVPGRPVVIDVLRVLSDAPHQYDLPLHFEGQFIATTAALDGRTDLLRPLGTANGYQHLWLRARAEIARRGPVAFTWLNAGRFYTYTTIADERTAFLLAELGAGDPAVNLRRQQAMIQRVANAEGHTFVSVLEAHGEYNGAEEFTVDGTGFVTEFEHYHTRDADLVRVGTRKGKVRLLGLARNLQRTAQHVVAVGNQKYKWRGPYAVFNAKGDKL